MQLTIRGLPPEIEEGVREEAKHRRTSLNKAVISLLEKALGRSKESETERSNHDLDRFSGVWTADEDADLKDRIMKTRKIDKELWD